MANKTNLYTNLGQATSSFQEMISRFGVVTVMNARIYDASKVKFDTMDAYAIYDLYKKGGEKATESLCELDTLKVANVTVDGPSKTVTGGQYSNPLIKFGKSARLEMQDALGNYKALEALAGGVSEFTDIDKKIVTGLHFGEDFSGPKMIVGDSFFISQKTGAQVKVGIIFYQFLPDSLFNLTQDAEGDATVFDLNGDLLTTEILVGTNSGTSKLHGVFYSIVDPEHASAVAPSGE